MKKLYFIVLFIGSMLVGCGGGTTNNQTTNDQTTANLSNEDAILQNAFNNKQSDLQVYGNGTVKKLLADDTKGSRHQRFILTLSSGQTVLISHNIDLAQKIDTLKVNDTVEFYGEYEWNAKGGVVHWTHDDPKGNHTNGWLKHEGITYH